MIKLDSYITINVDAMQSPNLTDRFSDDDLNRIGLYVCNGFDRDLESRSQWEKRMSAGMDLALQISKPKTFPWPNASNVAFPLVTIATMQFHSMAYPGIIQGNDVVKCRVSGGKDETGQLRARADRISAHMNYQVMEEDKAWEEQHDRLLINIPIVGCAFVKSYYSSSRRSNVSELVMARDFVLDYYATSVESCARKTHIIPLYRNEIYERVMRDTFRDVLDEAWYKSPQAPSQTNQSADHDKRTGMSPPQPDDDSPLETLEQHCGLDLDDDGYAEPYIITVDRTSKKVLRIVTRFEREEDIERNIAKKIIAIRPTEYFTKYSFIPSPDGGVYDLGFGVLLGPLNESVNSLINQLVDAGTMANSAGGFLGRGAKLRGGVYTFSPLEWKRVDATGDDLKKSIYPLPVREPSGVLFNLLSLLINYTNRIYGGTDMMVGENPGQNTPAETSRTMVQQGQKVYNTIYKRVWRSMKEEFKKLFVLNAVHMEQKKTFGNGGLVIMREDYLSDPDSVVPAADPHIMSDSDRFQQAQMLRQAAYTAPGYNVQEVEKNYLRSMRVESIDLFYPGPDKVPPLPNPKMQVEQLKLQGKQLLFKHQQTMFAAEMMEEHRLNDAKIAKLEAEVAAIINDVGLDKAKVEIAAFDAAIGAMRAHNEGLKNKADTLLRGLDSDRESTNGRGVSGMANAPGDQGSLQDASGLGGEMQGPMG